MATINAPSLLDTVYSGDCPLANAHGYITLASAASADKVRLNKVYAGTKIYDVRMVNAALGASTTVSLGYEYVNGEAGGGATALLAATSTSSAASTRQAAIAPITLQYDAYITATVGGGTATGQLDVVTTYEFKGK
jgi:cell division GTPase FtsZ